MLTLGIISASLAAGYFTRRFSENGILAVKGETLGIWRHRLQVIAIFCLLPFSAMLSLWGLPDPEPELMALPLLGLASYIFGGFCSIYGARLLKLDNRQTGSFFCCGTFTNIGAVGGLVCLLFLGEYSIAMAALYRLVEELYYFSIAFPIAQWYGRADTNKKINFRSIKIHPALGAIVLALLTGIGLHLAKIPRPEICGFLASAAMLVSTIFFLFAIGLALKISKSWHYWKESLTMCAIKFICIPALIIPLAWLVDYGAYEGGLPLKCVAILCSMPVAMTALVPPALFHLDIDLANACWIFSTIGLVLVLPWLMLLLPTL